MRLLLFGDLTAFRDTARRLGLRLDLQPVDVGNPVRRGQVAISVADDGRGIKEKDQTRVFEPFFSTKQNGSGLGLALIKRFVDDNDGEIHCETNCQGGVTFQIDLKEASPPRRTQ